jgi:hypothetical protein
MSSTKLPDSFSAAALTISRAATASFSSSVATGLGVKSRDTILRSRVCSGASWLMSSALVSSSCSDVVPSGIRVTAPLRFVDHRSPLREMALMSS